MMINSIKHIQLIFLIVLYILIIFACKKKSPVGPDISDLPALTDIIPFESLNQGKIVFERTGPYPGTYKGFYVIDIDNQKSWGFDLGLALSPAISPNGHKVAFTKYTSFETGTQYDVHLMDNDGTHIQNIARIEGQEYFPSWTPDGLGILFWGMNKLYMQSAAANATDRIVVKEFFIEVNDNDYLNDPSGPVTVSSKGKIAYVSPYTALSNIAGLYTMDMDGNNLKLLVPNPADSDLESPAFSPNGNQIAYLSVVQDSTFLYRSIEIVLMESDGSNPTSLAVLDTDGRDMWNEYGRNHSVSICWSPDGSKLLFNSPEGDFTSHIYVINSDGSNLTKVTSAEGVSDINCSWSR